MNFKEQLQNMFKPIKMPSIGKQEEQDRTLKTVEYIGVGANYYEESYKLLEQKNNDYHLNFEQLKEKGKLNRKIYKYNYINKPAKLIPEPNNKYDKNAIQIIVAGEVVGYISKDENIELLKILKTKEIKYISAFIYGGEYKIVMSEENTIKDRTNNGVRVTIGYV